MLVKMESNSAVSAVELAYDTYDLVNNDRTKTYKTRNCMFVVYVDLSSYQGATIYGFGYVIDGVPTTVSGMSSYFGYSYDEPTSTLTLTSKQGNTMRVSIYHDVVS